MLFSVDAEQHQSSMADVSEAEWADVIPDEDLADMYMEHDDNTASVMSVMDSEDGKFAYIFITENSYRNNII